MDKKVKKVWTAALRSGEYEQGQGTLCEETPDGSVKHCCLGVLLDVADEGDWFVPDAVARYACDEEGRIKQAVRWHKSIKDQRVAFAHTPERGVQAQLSQEQLQEFGITEDQHEKLMGMNDGGKNSFRRIAAWIDRYM